MAGLEPATARLCAVQLLTVFCDITRLTPVVQSVVWSGSLLYGVAVRVIKRPGLTRVRYRHDLWVMRPHGPIRWMSPCIYCPGRRRCGSLRSPRWSEVSGVVRGVSFPNVFPSGDEWLSRRWFAYTSWSVGSDGVSSRTNDHRRVVTATVIPTIQLLVAAR